MAYALNCENDNNSKKVLLEMRSSTCCKHLCFLADEYKYTSIVFLVVWCSHFKLSEKKE